MTEPLSLLEQLSDELLQFNQRLAKAQCNLQALHHIDVGQTPKTLIYQQDKLRLYHCPTNSEKRCKTPLLICYALVNKIYMIDLEPKRSLLKQLTEQGHDVYLIDWGEPDITDRYLDLEDYINGFLYDCVQYAKQHSESHNVDLLGICQGGTLSLCYTALHPDDIRKLVTLVTPVDFHTPDNLLTALNRHIDTELLKNAFGNLPGSALNNVYANLMPLSLGLMKNLAIGQQMSNEDSALSFLRMEHWLYDSPDQAGKALQEFSQQFFQQNRLIKGSAQVGEHRVSLARIEQPVLNIYGLKDHLVPPAASQALKQHIPAKNYSEIAIDAGHIGVFVSSKSQSITGPNISYWLKHNTLADIKKATQ